MKMKVPSVLVDWIFEELLEFVKGLYLSAWTDLNHQYVCSLKPAFLTFVLRVHKCLFAHFLPSELICFSSPQLACHDDYARQFIRVPSASHFITASQQITTTQWFECPSEPQSPLEFGSCHWQRNATLSFIFLHLSFENLLPSTPVATCCLWALGELLK